MFWHDISEYLEWKKMSRKITIALLMATYPDHTNSHDDEYGETMAIDHGTDTVPQ